MKNLRTTLTIVLLVLAASTASYAQAPQTYVSTSGADGNPCTSPVLPCRSLKVALTKTMAGGEISFVDSDESNNCSSGLLIIDKSITINGGASGGLMSCDQGSAIKVAAGPEDMVTLRNLNIHAFPGPLGNPPYGIFFVGGRTLRVEHVQIDGFQVGISTLVAGRMVVRDTTISCDPSTGSTGILVDGNGGPALVDIENTKILNGRFGLWAQDGSRVSVKNSSFSLGTSNSSAGIHAEGLGNGAEVEVDSSNISFFTYGVLARGSNAIVRVRNSVLTGNPSTVLSVAGGQIQSFGDNRVVGSTALGTLTAKSTK